MKAWWMLANYGSLGNKCTQGDPRVGWAVTLGGKKGVYERTGFPPVPVVWGIPL